ncbi:MAG: hypothetical protein GY801_06335 [bacterium]|nr:hypothetical protein [bacterium]
MPPLGPETLEQLQQKLDSDPETILAWAQDAWDEDISEEELRNILEEVEKALRFPETFLKKLDADEQYETEVAFSFGAERRGVHLVPPGFSFPGMTDEIPIDSTTRKFETWADGHRWVIFAGPFLLGDKLGITEKARFRWHTRYRSKFVYELEEPGAKSPVDIALFSDFGTGLYHSLYIAKQFREQKSPYAIHLGDVYYAGRRSEFRDNFEKPLKPILKDTSLFTINANHEMYSGGIPYFNYIDSRREAHPDRQKQEGSYFCLKSERFQIIGIDTDYHHRSRYKDRRFKEWLGARLREGRRDKQINILLSSNEPYEYGEKGVTLLFEDLGRFVRKDKLVDLWFWGNTHYCALFDWTKRTPFIGSCIGHGGYPYTRKTRDDKKEKKTPAPVLFLETAGRFPKSTGLRKNRGNNGYCVLRLHADGKVELKYIDWMGNPRYEITFSKPNGQDRLLVSSSAEHVRDGDA